MNIFQKAESEKSMFTKNDHKIYNFICKHPETAASCTIVQIAELSECSKSAVLRFCKKIGYAGYSEFRYDLIKYNRQSRTLPESGAAGLMISCIAAYEGALAEMRKMNPEQISLLADQIKKAPIVRTLGLGESGYCARFLASNLNLLGKPAIAITDIIEYFRSADTPDPKGLYICFSARGSYKAYPELPEAIRDCKARLFLITSSRKAPLKKYASETLLLPTVTHKGEVPLDTHSLMFIFISILDEYCRQMF